MKILAVVVGGSKGLGSEIVELLGANGFDVCSVARTKSRTAAFNVECNLESESSVRAAIKNLEERFADRQIAQFYWVAGYLSRGVIARAPGSELLKMIDINFRNPLLIAQWAYKKQFDSQSPSTFSVISSSAGLSEKPREDEAVYASTKAAQVSFTRGIGKANSSLHQKVSLFCPGGMKTELWSNNPNPEFESFLDPKKVAKVIVEAVANQETPYLEKLIPRGSL